MAIAMPLIAHEVGNTTQTNIAAFVNYLLSDNVRIALLVQVIIDPAH